MSYEFDIVIAGAGLSGLIAAALFSQDGHSIALVDPNKPITEESDPASDMRSTAFLQPARATLENAGVWPLLVNFATPLEVMRLADADLDGPGLRMVADFNASEISEEPFAWNLPNWLLRKELTAFLDNQKNVTSIYGQTIEKITTRQSEVRVKIGSNLAVAKLLIGADGRNSTVRDQLGIGVKTWHYVQRGLAFVVTHENPHDFVSTEIHKTGGPFTTVPLPDKDGKHFSSVIWMEKSDKADHLLKMSETDFNDALNDRSCGILGRINLHSHRSMWPIITQKSERLIGARTALVAEAAHVIPPIGAQGLNMSLADIDTLHALSNANELGSISHLDAYADARTSDINLRVRGVDALNRAAMAESASFRALRLKGLQTLHGFAPLRKSLMRKGLGA